MKIIATITDFGAKMNIGGDEERHSCIIDIPENLVPNKLRWYLNDKKSRKYSTISLSFLDEEPT